MAKDVVTIRNETLKFSGDKNRLENFSDGFEGTQLKDISSDFQKKVTLTKHDQGDIEAGLLYGNDETYRKMAGKSWNECESWTIHRPVLPNAEI